MISSKKCSIVHLFTFLGPPTEFGKMSPTFHDVADICLDYPERSINIDVGQRDKTFSLNIRRNDVVFFVFLVLVVGIFFQSIGRWLRPCQASLLDTLFPGSLIPLAQIAHLPELQQCVSYFSRLLNFQFLFYMGLSYYHDLIRYK